MARHAGFTGGDLDGADLRAVVGLIHDAKDDQSGPVLPWVLLDGLRELIPCVEIGLTEFDVLDRRYMRIQAAEPDGTHSFETDAEPADSIWFTEFPRFLRSQFPGGGLHAWSERMSVDQFRRVPLYEPFWQGMSDTLWVDLPARPGSYRKLCLYRTDGEQFDERDIVLLELLRPHLYEIDRLVRRRRIDVPRLTPREWEVLKLAAEGLGNQQIARALVTSLSTVRKHLEHIYLKTGTQSRGAAVAMMLPVRG